MSGPIIDLTEELRDGILWLTFNRPEARNALTFGMYERLAEVCATMPTDGSVCAMVVSGAGGKAFAAGTDMTQFRSFETEQDALEYEGRIDAVLEAVERCPVPTIAAVHGACTGGGASIAAACVLPPEIRISDRAYFGKLPCGCEPRATDRIDGGRPRQGGYFYRPFGRGGRGFSAGL